jgi:exodeoxyribonuclease III
MGETRRKPRLRIATWNVNSIRQRIGRLLGYLRDVGPDVLCLQEIKRLDERFPRMEIASTSPRACRIGCYAR